jgi:mono/diheme cytochrome c family protein
VQRKVLSSALWVAVLALLLATTHTACSRTPAAGSAKVTQIERGKYLVATSGCNDCHTPMKLGLNGPEPDVSRFLSGHPEDFIVGPPPALGEGGWLWAGTATNTAFAGPWGISFAANLTPDAETGMGIWNEEMFITTMREGKIYGGGRQIMPPMPWPAYRNLSDDDLKAMFAYLQSLQPITNHVPEYRPPAG